MAEHTRKEVIFCENAAISKKQVSDALTTGIRPPPPAASEYGVRHRGQSRFSAIVVRGNPADKTDKGHKLAVGSYCLAVSLAISK
jgi:hypothetical protein